ncbi:MAG: TrbC family F-type conjugative pilus assembly protein [Methylovulum sp.]|nr:TrbC family F-type conjugative pilus assembly protein [Methylovulum sp.]
MRFQFFSSYLTATALILSASSVAQAADEDFFLKGIIRKQQPELASRRLPDWLQTKPASLNPEFEQLLKPGKSFNAPNNSASEHTVMQGRWIFVSFGMPAEEMKAAAEEASATHSLLVFRGVEKDGNTGSITRRLYKLIKPLKPVPATVIDPLLFTRFNVTAVPTMIESNSQQETRIARGLPGFEWLSKQDPGDAGQKGPVFEITEPDMIEEMKRRMENIDWARQKEDAVAGFWKKQDEFVLPVAKENRTRNVDVSIVSSQDIRHPDGRIIFKKGDKINPQAIIPMRHAYIVFDATRQEQVKIAKKMGDVLLKKQRPVVYLFSKIDKDSGWKHYNETVAILNGPIYKLNKQIVDRFQLQALPSLIEGQGDHVVVSEVLSEER